MNHKLVEAIEELFNAEEALRKHLNKKINYDTDNADFYAATTHDLCNAYIAKRNYLNYIKKESNTNDHKNTN